MLRPLLAMCCGFALLSAAATAADGAHSDDFSGPLRSSVWQVLDADAPRAMTIESGWLRVTAGIGGFPTPWDRAEPSSPMLLLELPGNEDAFTLETHMRVLRPAGTSSPAGLAIFRKDRMALWVWGVAKDDRVVLYECDLQRIGPALGMDIEPQDDPAAGVWLQIAKDGDEYAFRHGFQEDDEWIERTEWPRGRRNFGERFSSGEYLVGIIATHGRQEYDVEFDYFDSPELGVLGVDAAGKLLLAWADLRTH